MNSQYKKSSTSSIIPPHPIFQKFINKIIKKDKYKKSYNDTNKSPQPSLSSPSKQFKHTNSSSYIINNNNSYNNKNYQSKTLNKKNKKVHFNLDNNSSSDDSNGNNNICKNNNLNIFNNCCYPTDKSNNNNQQQKYIQQENIDDCIKINNSINNIDNSLTCNNNNNEKVYNNILNNLYDNGYNLNNDNNNNNNNKNNIVGSINNSNNIDNNNYNNNSFSSNKDLNCYYYCYDCDNDNENTNDELLFNMKEFYQDEPKNYNFVNKRKPDLHDGILFKNKIKEKFLNNNDIESYKKFKRIFLDYHQKQYPIIFIYYQLILLFKGHQDLINEYIKFLPDEVEEYIINKELQLKQDQLNQLLILQVQN